MKALNPLLILLESGESTRIRYTLDFLFLEVLKLPYKTISSEDSQASLAHVQYCSSKELGIPGPLFIPNTHLLYTNAIISDDPSCTGTGQYFKMFVRDGEFDLFSMVFFLLTRMEEYTPHKKDAMGRPLFSDFFSVKYKFSHLPLLDQLIHDFYRQLRKKFTSLPELSVQTQVLFGIDIDHMYLHANMPVYWKILALSKSIFQLNFYRFRKILFPPTADKDPYAQYSQWAQPLLDRQIPLNVFVLSHRIKGLYDRNTCNSNPWFRYWIENFMRQFPVIPQWHPSIQSRKNFRVLQKEKEVLEKITRHPITQSRQHFLDVKMPLTYRNLLALGICEDHSMGFYDRVGFRSSTAYSHYWYDLSKEKITSLRLIPPSLMDAQLKNYMKLDPVQGIEIIKKLRETLQKTGGYFSIIWHNSSFETSMGWEGWNKVFDSLLEE
jgi:hypothetical protein